MVSTRVVHFDAVCRGSLNWRVSVNGEDEHVAFASREMCLAAASARARQRHLDTGVRTDVRAPDIDGKLVPQVSYMLPQEHYSLCAETESESSLRLREACDFYGMAPRP